MVSGQSHRRAHGFGIASPLGPASESRASESASDRSCEERDRSRTSADSIPTTGPPIKVDATPPDRPLPSTGPRRALLTRGTPTSRAIPPGSPGRGATASSATRCIPRPVSSATRFIPRPTAAAPETTASVGCGHSPRSLFLSTSSFMQLLVYSRHICSDHC